MKRFISVVLAVVLSLSIVATFASCGGGKTPDSISVCLASEPASIDPALNSAIDGASLILHAFSGIAGYRQTESGALELFPDCVVEFPEAVIGEDGKATYTFTLRDGLTWSDGSALTAADFVYSWKRAVSPNTGADYGYMFDVIDGYDEAAAGADTLNVTAIDEKTLQVVLKNDVTYFFELLAFPTYMPVKQSVVEANPDGWATDPATYIGNGPYVMTEWVHDSKIVYTKNENFYNADAITAKEIVFYLSDDENNMLANFKNGSWLFIDSVPVAELKTLQTENPNEFFVEGQLGIYYANFNVNFDLLPHLALTGAEKEAALAEVRKAFSLLIDRNYICDEIDQSGSVPASTFVPMGLTDADGQSEFYMNAGDKAANGYIGYYAVDSESFVSNVEKAIEILKKYYTYDEATKQFTNVPSMTYLYNTADNHKAIGEYIQQALGVYGITISLENQEWNTFLETRKSGDYVISRNGWLADYNDPISFLDMWQSHSGNNDVQLGKGAHAEVAAYSLDLTDLGIDYKVENGTWAETYDYLISLVKSTSDTETRYALMHKAEDMLMDTGALVSMFYYTDTYMCSDKLEGVFASPLGYKFFMYSTLSNT